jgi:hypothetical protein
VVIDFGYAGVFDAVFFTGFFGFIYGFGEAFVYVYAISGGGIADS